MWYEWIAFRILKKKQQSQNTTTTFGNVKGLEKQFVQFLGEQ